MRLQERRSSSGRGSALRRRLGGWVRWPILVPLVAVVLLGAAVWAAWASPLLALQRVAVSGTSATTVAQVRALAAVAPGTPLLQVDTDAVAARVAAAQRIARVDVVRRWPNTLAIAVQERVPVAALEQDGDYLLIDVDGVELDVVEEAPERLPVLGMPDQAGSTARESREAGLAVLKALPSALRNRVEKLSARSPEDVTLELADGREVVWGSADRSERKVLVLRALLRQEADVYDVSAPNAPTTR